MSAADASCSCGSANPSTAIGLASALKDPSYTTSQFNSGCKDPTLGDDGYSSTVAFRPRSRQDHACDAARPDILREASDGATRAVAIATQQSHLERFGHVFPYVFGFFCSLVLPRRRHLTRGGARRNASTLSLYLPTGSHLEARPLETGIGHRAFEEVAGLYSNGYAGLEIHRAPWVPYCHRPGGRPGAAPVCCVRLGRVPDALRGQVSLLTGFPGDEVGTPTLPHALDHRGTSLFRSYAQRGLLGRRSSSSSSQVNEGEEADEDEDVHADATSSPPTVVWLLSGGSNGRRIAHEEKLVEAVRAWLRAHRPAFALVAVQSERLPFVEAARLVAGAAALVGLFGSALQYCLLLPRGAVVIEVHGALGNDLGAHWLYCNLCAHRLGHRWMGYAVESAQPRLPGSRGSGNGTDDAEAALRLPQSQWLWQQHDGWWRANDGASSAKLTARVDVAAFVAFFARVMRGNPDEWAALLHEYEAVLRAHPDPDRRRRVARGDTKEGSALWGRWDKLLPPRGDAFASPGARMPDGLRQYRRPWRYASVT